MEVGKGYELRGNSPVAKVDVAHSCGESMERAGPTSRRPGSMRLPPSGGAH